MFSSDASRDGARHVLARPIALAIGLTAFCAFAQNTAPPSPPAGDPLRWYQPDTTPQQRYQTARNEATSALRDALKECKTKKGAEARSCNKEAHDNYKSDMLLAKQKLNESSQGAQ